MDTHAKSIFDALSAAGIEHDEKSLARHHTQGIMNSVYTISTPHGGLFIHVCALTPPLEHFRVWEKLKPVSQFLRAIPDVPAAEVLLVVKFPHHFLVVQKKLPGTGAGTVEIKDGDIVLTWKETPGLLERQLEDMVASVHAAPLEGFGLLVATGDGIRGQYGTWEEFLAADVPLWIEGIAGVNRTLNAGPDTMTEDAYSYLAEAVKRVAPLSRASLVSCDAMNPSNVLVEKGNITGIIDWEWAFASDPAWEFCYMNQFSLKHYFSRFPALAAAEAQREFRKRARIYEYLSYIMWTFATSGNPESPLFTVQNIRLKKILAEAKVFWRQLDKE